jgi:toll-like receptor 2
MNNLLNLTIIAKFLITLSPEQGRTKCVNTTVCPKHCRCSYERDGGMMLDCSNAGFNHVPDMIPDTVVAIDLSNNALSEISNDSFVNCTNVTKLNLSDNKLSVLRNAMLKSMPNLEIIVLDGSYLLYSDSSFPDDTFAGLLHLKSVSIGCNGMFCSGRESYVAYALVLQNLPQTLVDLSILIPGDKNISLPLSKFTKLKKLGVQGVSGTFNTITNDTFKPLEHIQIEELTIMAFNLSRVESHAFYHFPELKSLSIRGLYSLSVADFYPALVGLHHTKLEKLHLSSSYYFDGVYSAIPNNIVIPEMVILNESFCNNLDFHNLTHLHIDHSLLFQFRSNNGCVSRLSNLKVLNLPFNFFSMFEIHTWNLHLLIHLVELDVSHQDVIFFVPFDIHFNLPKNLKSLDFSFTQQPSAETSNFTINIQGPTNLKYFNFQGNYVRVLKTFTVQENNPCTLLEADFSRNNMISFEEAILTNNLLMENLNLSNNQLGKQMDERGDRVFTNFWNLTNLDLTLNGIKRLPYSIFENLYKLECLNLSKNSLILIDFKMSHLRNLILLDVSENLVSQFNTQLQNDIDEVKLYSPNFTINMLGNPVQCSCETRSFLRWMYDRRSMFERFDYYTCIYNENLTTFMDMEQLLTTLDSDCSSTLVLKVTVSLFAFILKVLAHAIFVYRHKWGVLKFFLLEYITNRKLYREFNESEKEYEYDAFISFHSDDQDWVWNELYKLLDITYENADTDNDQRRFKLCIHERDFVLAELIEENILRSIESSRETIVVLSKNFIQSAWCEFELQIARKECIERGRDLIIAVMLEPLPADIKLSRSVERLIRKNTYIEWSTNPLKRMHFWNRIRSALTN